MAGMETTTTPIRIDAEVRRYLLIETRGKETFNSTLRRLLGIDHAALKELHAKDTKRRAK